MEGDADPETTRERPITKLVTTTKTIDSGLGKISVAYASRRNGPGLDCMFIAHGVKGSMNSSIVSFFHSALAAEGFLTVKFNFPYAEGRARFLRKPDKKDVLVECYRRVVEDARKSHWKPRRLFLGGLSLGAAVASHVVADGPDIQAVKGLFFLSYPLHKPGRSEMRGDEHLYKISKPMLFVSGTRDVYADPEALRSTLRRLGGTAEAYWVENGDHAFNKRKGRAIYAKTLHEIVGRVAEWVNSVARKPA